VSDLSVIFVLIFAAASLSTYAFYWIFVFNRREHQVINRRLDLSRTHNDASVVLDTLRRERGFSSATNPLLRLLSDWLAQTGIRVQRAPMILALVSLCLALVLLFSLVLQVGLPSMGLAVVVTVGIVILYFVRQRSRRVLAFSEQLPDAIDVIVRGVRVGLPFSTAVALVAREMPDPVGTEFGMLGDEIAFGLDVRTALENLNRRVGQDDLLFLTVAVGIQIQTGGNLGEILARLSRLMRNRATMRLKIRALSAEGRASAYALSAFPFVLLVVLNFLSPAYYGSIRSNSLVEPAIYVGLFLLIVGNFIIYRMVNFKY
jgi:tight adherence protein B